MTGNDLKKLNRKQLLELLLKQTLRVEELEAKLTEAEKQLAAHNMIEEMEKHCRQREAEAEQKLLQAMKKITEAEHVIAAAKEAAAKVSVEKKETDKEKQTSEKSKAVKAEKKTEDNKPADALDAFFAGVIGKK